MNVEFVTSPDERIRFKSREVVAFDKSLRQLIENLIETAQVQQEPPALGLAACQIAVAKKVFVAKVQNKFRAFVNGRIVKKSKEETALLEGCFSVPGIYGQVRRPAEITIEAQDISGRKIKRSYKGFPAKIIQHEIDHADGILFVDHVREQNGKLFRVKKGKDGREQLVEVGRIVGM